jgi:hypothetical protein
MTQRTELEWIFETEELLQDTQLFDTTRSNLY